MLRVLICGSRGWTDTQAIRNIIKKLWEDTDGSLIIIHGKCKTGADAICDSICTLNGIPMMVFPANWNKFGKSAGPIRNQTMLDMGLPDRVIAFSLGTSGTKDMINRAEMISLPVTIIKGIHSLD